MPVTFGMMNAGDWPATAPATATVKGVFGFLPDTNVREVQRMLADALQQSPHPWLREHAQIRFSMLNNDGNSLAPDHPLVCAMQEGARKAGTPLEVSALTAACDAWRYSNVLGIPTVVYGAGSLKYAHSNDEHVALEDLRQAAHLLLRFLEGWCGFEQRQGDR
jgi:acetylornithine deacetylase